MQNGCKSRILKSRGIIKWQLTLVVGSLIPALTVIAPSAAAQSSNLLTREELELSIPKPSPTERTLPNPYARALIASDCPFTETALVSSFSKVSFIGYTDAALSETLQKLLAKITVDPEKNLSTVCDLRDAANEILFQNGWVATTIIPQQNLQNELMLQIISGRIAELSYSGDVESLPSSARAKLEKLKDLSPLNTQDIEAILLAVNSIPGVQSAMSLSPASGSPGQLSGNIRIQQKKAAAFVNVRNYNPEFVGRETLYGRVEFYGLTGLADTTYVGAQATGDFQEQFVIQAGHEFGLGRQNTRVGVDAIYATADPDLGDLDLETESLLISVSASHPIWRTPNSNLDVSIGLDYVEQETDVSETPLSRDSLRSLFVRADLRRSHYSRSGKLRANLVSYLELRRGLDIFDATDSDASGFATTDGVSASRPFGDAQAFIIKSGFNAYAPIGRRLGAALRVEGQWANNPALNFEEYSVGNLTIGRGYDPGSNTGDRAIGASIEVNANVLNKNNHKIDVFGFYDTVTTTNLDFGTLDRSRTLNSTGAGMRLTFSRNISAELTYAKPLSRIQSSNLERPSDRVLFSITTKISPLFR